MRHPSGSTCAALVASVCLASRAHAALIASESFSYPVAPLNAQAGGSGWSGAWITGQSTVFGVQASSLTGTIGTSGGALLYDGSKAVSGNGARIFRALDLAPGSAAAIAGVAESTTTRFNGRQLALGRPGTVVWFGALVNGGTAGNGLGGVQYLAQFHFYNGATTTPTALALADNNKDGEAIAIGRGNLNTTWNYERTCAHDQCPSHTTSSSGYLSSAAFDSGTHWLVMRFDFASAASTSITTWLDPAPGAGIPADAAALTIANTKVVAVDGLHFNWIEMGGQTSRFAFDEIRFATAFSELAANGTLAAPPPSAMSVRLAAGPSPFRSALGLDYTVSRAEPVELDVFSVDGRIVRHLAQGMAAAGDHHVTWDGADDAGRPLDPGVLLVRLHTSEGDRTAKVAHLR